MEDVKIDFCGNPVGINDKVEKCSKLFDEEKFREDFEKICAGKTSCHMKLPSDLHESPYIRKIDYSDKVKLEKLNMTMHNETDMKECMHEKASLYRQFHCGYEGNDYIKH